ncbi:MAG: NAD(P)-binding domain-containing protein, partial [Reyranella sp.]|nr:NAD(P)-binding domain-containing protein [Reyranella sp.]
MGKLLLVGCGKMGGAMLDGWLARGLAAADVVVAEPVEAIRPKQAGLRVVSSSSEIGETPEIVVLAVKPQSMDATLTDLKRFVGEGPNGGAVFLSIAAGKTL